MHASEHSYVGEGAVEVNKYVLRSLRLAGYYIRTVCSERDTRGHNPCM